MKKYRVSLNTMDKIKGFIYVTSKLDCDVNLVSGRYVVDGKSIMGIFSLDLSKPIEVNINSECNVEKEFETYMI